MAATTHRIAVIGGDGIGPEVTAEALRVVRAAGVDVATTEFDLGGGRYLRDGEILSDATLAELRGFDAILLGAVGTPAVPPPFANSFRTSALDLVGFGKSEKLEITSILPWNPITRSVSALRNSDTAVTMSD